MEETADLLYYEIKDGEYIFFFNHEMLFKNSKNNPFVHISVNRQGVKKELPLYYCDIEKIAENEYKARFYNKGCMAVFYIFSRENRVYFKFHKKGYNGEKMNINLFRKPGKTKGFGFHENDEIINKPVKRYFKPAFYKRYEDKRLNFYVKDGFYFVNDGIEDWEVQFLKSIRISTRQNDGGFILDFDKKIVAKEGRSEIFRFLKTENTDEYYQNGDNYGFITPYSYDAKLINNVPLLRRNGRKYYIIASPVVSSDDKDFTRFDKSGLFKIEEGKYLVKFDNDLNYRLMANRIRSYLDLNCDGLYIDERNIKLKEQTDGSQLLVYKNFADLIENINREYPEKEHIYNKFNSGDKVGFIYSVRFKDLKKNPAKYKQNLADSGVKEFYVEGNFNQLKKIQKFGYTAIIIKE